VPAADARSPQAPRLWPLALGTLVLALGVGGWFAAPLASAIVERWGQAPDAGPPSPVRATVGGVALTVPRDLVRFDHQRRDGEQPRLDLALPWPPGSQARARTPAEGLARLVFISIAPKDEAVDPVRRLAAVYGRFLDGDLSAETQGLAVRRFRPGSGYDGEELVYDPARPGAYFVRCAPAAGDAPPACMRETRLGDRLDVVVRFPRSFLREWRQLDRSVEALLAAIGAPPG
jgi:hypothetical protein